MKIFPIALFAVLAQAPAPQQVRGSIRGVVVRWGSSDPLPQTIVELRADTGARPIASTATSEKGEFVFPAVVPGRYRVLATRSGYAPAEYGQRRPGGSGQTIALAAGQQRTGIDIAMSAGATVYGRVVDRNGQPLAFADIRLEKLDYKSGRAGLIAVQSTITNDLGEYRIFWITPGQYYLRASATNNQNFGGAMLVNPIGADSSRASFGSTTRVTARVTRVVGLEEGESFSPIYYPTASDVQNASLIDLKAGSEFNANFTMIPVRTRDVRGTVIDELTNHPVQGTLRISLYPVDRYLQSGGTVLQFNPNNGGFQFTGVRPGSYELGTVLSDASGLALVDVADRDIEVALRVSPLTKLSGTVRIEGRPATFPADLSGLMQIAIRGSLAQLTGAVSAAGDFEIQKVPVGRYQIAVQPFAPLSELPTPAGSTPGPPRARPPVPAIWQDAYVKSIRLADGDVFNGDLTVDGQPLGQLEVVVGLSGSSVEGRALNGRQEPVSNATVVLVPSATSPVRSERFRSATANDDGQFQLRGIAPGEYIVYAWEDVDPGAWFDPAFMRLHEASGQQILVGEAQKLTLNVYAIAVP